MTGDPPTGPITSDPWCHNGDTYQVVTPVNGYATVGEQRMAHQTELTLQMSLFPPNC